MFAARNMTLAGGFNPLSLNPLIWYDGSDANTMYDATTGGALVSSGGSIARLNDKTGNAYHATQATSTNQPIRDIVSSANAVKFDGTNDRMFSNFGASLSGVSAMTISFFGQVSSKTEQSFLAINYDAFNRSIFWASTNAIRCFICNGTLDAGFSFAKTLSGGFVHLVWVFDGTQTGNSNRLKLYVDGVLVSPTYTGTIPATTFTGFIQSREIGSYAAQNSWSYQGRMTDFMAFATAKTQDEITSLYNYVRKKNV